MNRKCRESLERPEFSAAETPRPAGSHFNKSSVSTADDLPLDLHASAPPAFVDCLRDVKAWLWHNVRTPNENKTEIAALEATALWASRPSHTVRNTGVCLDSSLKLEKH